MLRKVRMEFDLVDGWLVSPHFLELLKVRDGPVADSDGLYLA